MTDLDADVDDPLDRWEDVEDLPDIASDDPSEVVSQIENANGDKCDDANSQTNGDSQGISDSVSRLLSVGDHGNLSPIATSVSNPTYDPSPPLSVFDRRATPADDMVGVTVSARPMEYLRPITPTEPLVESESMDRTHTQTPTVEQLVNEGPMTPTNTAGPFVFDGSAGRTSGSGMTPKNAPAAA